MLTRSIQKGNAKNESYTLRITETDGNVYIYLYLNLEDGESVIYSRVSSNLKGTIEIPWDDVPMAVKEAHYKKLYPKDNLNEYEKNCFFYGKQNADEIKAKADEREKFLEDEEHLVPFGYTLASKIYDKIGAYEKVDTIYNKWPYVKVVIDDKYYIETHGVEVISVETKAEYDASRKNWGKKVKQIAQLAGTSFEMATIVAEVPQIDKAVIILKQIKEILHNADLASYYEFYSLSGINPVRIVKGKICEQLPKEYVVLLNWNKKFYNSVEGILKNKK